MIIEEEEFPEEFQEKDYEEVILVSRISRVACRFIRNTWYLAVDNGVDHQDKNLHFVEITPIQREKLLDFLSIDKQRGES